MKSYRKTYNDGILTYGRKVTDRSPTGTRKGSKFVAEGKLAFHEMSRREQDHRMAEVMTSTLNLKVSTPYPVSFRDVRLSGLKVVIRNIEYDVIRAEPDNEKRELFFFLQEVGDFVE